VADEQFSIDVHVRPGARRTSVGGEHDGALTVAVNAPAVDGRANEAVVAALAAAFAVRPAAVSIVRGATSRRKSVRIAGDVEHLAAMAVVVRRPGR
jgi:uncharacterized protein (TIGR00251 family)